MAGKPGYLKQRIVQAHRHVERRHGKAYYCNEESGFDSKIQCAAAVCTHGKSTRFIGGKSKMITKLQRMEL